MAATVAQLDDARIQLLADYITGLDPELHSPGPTVDGGSAAYATCVSCHGADAQGNTSLGAPSLLYQDSAYLTQQLQQYRDGGRTGTMAAFVKGWSDDEIDAVVGHIACLRPERAAFTTAEGSASEAEGLAAFADIYSVATHPPLHEMSPRRRRPTAR